MDRIPVIGITMGDPSGIGPEIIMKLVEDKDLMSSCYLVIFGDTAVLRHYNRAGIEINEVDKPLLTGYKMGRLDVIPVSNLKKEDYIPSSPTRNTARAMAQYIITATEMAMDRKIDAIVTCPISKILLRDAGYKYEGHTQFLSHLTHTPNPVMMLAGERLRVSLVTIHRALREVPDILDMESIIRTIRITSESLKMDFNIPFPRIAVSALNPHAGEGGIMGDEEKRVIMPAVEQAREDGIDATGPYPADTVFWRAQGGEFDVVVSMYHDQGLIPIKLLHFNDAVNITLGLPIIRTSVDHGTAYDIAGKGIASCDSLRSAILMAVEMVKNRRMYLKNKSYNL